MSQENKVCTTFSYNGAEFEFDVRDAEMAEQFENAIEAMRVAEKDQPKEGKISALIKYQADFLKKFFDDCLGEGAGVKICGERSNLTVCYEAYEMFLNHVARQRDYLQLSNPTNPFSKYSNRSQKKSK